jgi:hypothetical protein
MLPAKRTGRLEINLGGWLDAVVDVLTSFPRGVRELTRVGDLTCLQIADLQLRDSTGLHLHIVWCSVTGFAIKPSHPGDKAPWQLFNC